MSGTARRFLLDSLVFTLARGLVSLRGLIVLPLFGALGAKEYGTFTQVMVFVNLVRPIVTWKLDTAIVRFLTGEESRERQRAWFYAGLAFVIASSALISLVLLGLSSPMSRLVFGTSGMERLTPALACTLWATVLGGYSRQFYRIDDRVKTLSAFEVAEAAVETVAIAATLLTYKTVESAVWSVAVTRALGALARLIHAGMVFGGPSALPRREDLLPMLRFGFPLIPDAVLAWAVDYADRIVIAHFLDLDRLGLYAASYSLAMVLNLGLAPLSFVFYPQVLRAWKEGKRESVTQQFTLVSRYSLLLSVPAAVGMALMAPPLLQLLAGKAFVTDPWLVLSVALGIAMNAVFQTSVYIFHIAERTTYIIRFLIAGAALNLVLNLALVPVIELHGAALATLATYAFLTVWATRAGREWVRFHIAWLDVAKAVVASAVMGLLVSQLPLYSWVGLVLAAPLGVACYAGLMLLTRGVTLAELRDIRSALSAR